MAIKIVQVCNVHCARACVCAWRRWTRASVATWQRKHIASRLVLLILCHRLPFVVVGLLLLLLFCVCGCLCCIASYHVASQHHKDVTPTAKLGAGLRRIAGTGRTPLVLVAFGALNPVHLNHLRMFQTARAFIERNTDFGVIGGYLCPAHDK